MRVFRRRSAAFGPLLWGPLRALVARRPDPQWSAEAARAHERQRRVLLTALASSLAKAVAVGTMLVSVPLTLAYLGSERYGVWVTISSFSLMLTFADLGIGNGLLTSVSRANGEDDHDQIRAYVSSAALILSAIAIVIASAGSLIATIVDWSAVFRIHSATAQREAGPAMQVFLTCFALSLPATLIQRVQLGLQRGFLSSLWQCGASIGTLCSVVVAAWLAAPLPWLVAAFLGPPLVVGLINSLFFFVRQMPSIAPAPAFVSRVKTAEIMRAGSLFFILQITLAVAFFSDSLLISSTLGARYVTEYSIADRLFSTISQLVGFVVLPLWPAFGEALARNDSRWAWRTLVRGTSAAFVASLTVSATLLAGSSLIIRHWVGPSVDVSFALLCGFAAWRVVEASAGPASMYLNALQAVRFQVVCAIAMASCALTLKLVLIRSLGVAVLPWITVCSYVLLSGVPAASFLRARRPVQHDAAPMSPA